jgi:hypothetical protein
MAGIKTDTNMDIDLFPENKFDPLDEKNKKAISEVKKMEAQVNPKDHEFEKTGK